MILLFTSDNCTWCDVVKSMLKEEMENFHGIFSVYEVDIKRYEFITEAYNVLVVPTLVSKKHVMSGVPTIGDLQSFLFQTATESSQDSPSPKSVIWAAKNKQSPRSDELDTESTLHQ